MLLPNRNKSPHTANHQLIIVCSAKALFHNYVSDSQPGCQRDLNKAAHTVKMLACELRVLGLKSKLMSFQRNFLEHLDVTCVRTVDCNLNSWNS